jgi:hypothetical protein
MTPGNTNCSGWETVHILWDTTAIAHKSTLKQTLRVCLDLVDYICVVFGDQVFEKSVGIPSLSFVLLYWQTDHWCPIKSTILIFTIMYELEIKDTTECKIYTIPILMYQMRISITYITSVMLRPKKLKIRNLMTVNIPRRPKIECCEMEPNPSKDRAIHDGDHI